MWSSQRHLIKGAESVVEDLGYWPSFHDSALRSAQREGDVCRVTLYGFRITSRSNKRGHLILEDHFKIQLELAGVSQCDMPLDYTSDVLFDIEIEGSPGDLTVYFDSVADTSWSARCASMRILTFCRRAADESVPE